MALLSSPSPFPSLPGDHSGGHARSTATTCQRFACLYRVYVPEHRCLCFDRTLLQHPVWDKTFLDKAGDSVCMQIVHMDRPLWTLLMMGI
jgi:hypothetical protein